MTPLSNNDNLQFNFMEEKKTNPSFKREMKVFKEEMEEEIQEIKSENKKEIKNLEQNFQQSIIEKIQANNFVQIKNKWGEIVHGKCCENECINTDKPIGSCIKGNGFINIIDGGNITYINCVGEGKLTNENLIILLNILGENKDVRVNAEKKFKKPIDDCINYSLFYFEIKCKIEGVKSDENWMVIGLRNGNNAVKLDIDEAFIRCEFIIKKDIKFKLPSFSWSDGDVFGLGLVYPPNNKINELPYVFFTQNGKLIGKSLLLKDDDCDNYEIFAHLKRCSIETNFGNDFKAKPFVYNITEHSAPKEFYVDSDGSIDEPSLTSKFSAF
ncbi:unnamed protein product [Meloidogyne enterolobii]|uniref:Uncharacterized protein n=1 Tax=Meloidogyne enterolobii TaxID=390850 RepID=A0ACB0YLA2_MELEN